MPCWLYIVESNEISIPGLLFEEFVLDIADDAQEYATCEEISAANDRLHSHRRIRHRLGEEQDCENLSVSELEEAAAASVKPDKHFELFKEAVMTNTCQV